MNFLTDYARQKFDEWYFENFKCHSDIEHWLYVDQLLCYSKFFGFSIHTIEKLKEQNKLYNRDVHNSLDSKYTLVKN